MSIFPPPPPDAPAGLKDALRDWLARQPAWLHALIVVASIVLSALTNRCVAPTPEPAPAPQVIVVPEAVWGKACNH